MHQRDSSRWNQPPSRSHRVARYLVRRPAIEEKGNSPIARVVAFYCPGFMSSRGDQRGGARFSKKSERRELGPRSLCVLWYTLHDARFRSFWFFKARTHAHTYIQSVYSSAIADFTTNPFPTLPSLFPPAPTRPTPIGTRRKTSDLSCSRIEHGDFQMEKRNSKASSATQEFVYYKSYKSINGSFDDWFLWILNAWYWRMDWLWIFLLKKDKEAHEKFFRKSNFFWKFETESRWNKREIWKNFAKQLRIKSVFPQKNIAVE